jgi:hypothetical protein
MKSTNGTQLCQHMACLRPVLVTHHTSPGTFVHKDLHQVAMHWALEPPYSSPYQILSRKDKMPKLLVRGKPVTVSTDRVKPAYIFHEADFKNTFYNCMSQAMPATTLSSHLHHRLHQFQGLHAPVVSSIHIFIIKYVPYHVSLYSRNKIIMVLGDNMSAHALVVGNTDTTGSWNCQQQSVISCRNFYLILVCLE